VKILSADQIRQLDTYTIENEPIESINLMERAARNCVDWILSKEYAWLSEGESRNHLPILIICGKGNNGGDGLAMARILDSEGFPVRVAIVEFSSSSSPDFATNLERLREAGVPVSHWRDADDLRRSDNTALIIDAIFGTGLNRPPEGLAADVIRWINAIKLPVISIDLPSGLFSDASSIDHWDKVVQSTYTLSFQCPKLAFFLSDNESLVGEVHVLDIGLDGDFLASIPSRKHVITRDLASGLLMKRSKFSHKGSAGHTLIVGGSSGKWGAAVISGRAALRSGAGLVTVHTGANGAEFIHHAQPELMVSADVELNCVSELPDLSPFDAVAIGPGLGLDENSQRALKLLIQNSRVPVVLDADALNILAENRTWMSFLPQGSILTPHPGEFARLAGRKLSHFEMIQEQLEMSRKMNVFIVLKGAHTSISTPDGNLFINTTGNPGMSTAGMGDALTGILGALISNGYGSLQAAILGVFVHGLAGDMALENQSHESLITQDLIEHLGPAFNSLRYG
jgi:NAD(P)H-hydrate epimerase